MDQTQASRSTNGCIFCLLFLTAAGGADAAPALKVPLMEGPLPMADVREVGGYVGERMNANREGYLKSFGIDHYTRMVEEKKQRDWWWIGEQPGKWLESAVLASEESGDTALGQEAHGILARLEAAQEPGGYLGITDPAVRTPEKPLRGMDPYELYFMLHGLLTAAEEWREPKALETARKLGDYFVAHIGPGKAEFWPSPYRPPANLRTIICPQVTWVPEGTPKAPKLYDHSEIAGHTAHYCWEGTLLADPMLRLYEATGDRRYLDWCRWVVSNMDKWSGWNSFSRLDEVAAGRIGVHELQPYVHAHTFQMNFLGFLRLYQITGEASLLAKVRGAWADVARRQMYITGGVSVGEHYEPGYRRPLGGDVVETCATMSWMQLTQYLLELTGEVRYADAIERLLWNHVFASQTIDGDCYRYHTPPNGFKPQGDFHGPDCCTGSGHRLVSMLPAFFYAQGPGGLYVNQFVASKASFKLPNGTPVVIRQQTEYPQETTVLLRVEPLNPARFALNVRIPAWCDAPVLEVNGKPSRITAGTYARLRRTWKPGDTVRLTLPMKVHWVVHEHFTESVAGGLPGGGKDRVAGSVPQALMRGPVVYALDTVWWDDPSAAMPVEVGREVRLLREREPRLAPTPPRTLGPAYEVVVLLRNGKTATARMLPFTNVGRWYRDGEPKPERNSRAFSYAVWLP